MGREAGYLCKSLDLKRAATSVHWSTPEHASGGWWSMRLSDTWQGVLICVLCPLGVLASSWLPTSTPPGLTVEVWIQVLPPKMEDRNRLGLRSRKMNKQSEWSRIPSFGKYWKQIWASPVTQMAKNLPAMQETRVWSLGWEDSLEKYFAWRIPRTEEPDELQSMGSQRIRHDWATNTEDFFTQI